MGMCEKGDSGISTICDGKMSRDTPQSPFSKVVDGGHEEVV